MNKRKTFMLILIFANIFVPILVMFTPNGKADFLSEGEQFSFTGFQNIDPRLAFDENGTIHYVYTRVVTEISDYEVVYYNNSDGDIFVPAYEDLSEGLGVSSPNSLNNRYPDIDIDLKNNSTIHTVWQGDTGGDTNIYYSNNSNGCLWDYILTFDDGGNDEYASVAAINGNVFIAYHDGTEIRMKTNYQSNWLGGSSIDVDPSTGTKPKLSIWYNETDWRLDLAYIAGANLLYSYIWSDDPITDLVSNSNNIGTGATPSDLSIDSTEDLAVISYARGGNIYVINNTPGTGYGSTKQVTSTADSEGHPDVVLNENNIAQIFYVSNNSGTGHSSIRVVDNYGADYFDNEEIIIDKAQIDPNCDELYTSGFDAELGSGEGIMLLYNAAYKAPGSGILTLTNYILFINGYANTYNDGSGDYNYYTWDEELQGNVYTTGWLIEGIQISYDTASDSDVDLKIKLTDKVTNVTWENTSTFVGTGGKDVKQLFFSPGNYFIAQNQLEVVISNGTNQQDLVRIEIDPLMFTNITVNASSNYVVNGSSLLYRFYEIGGSGLEGTVFMYDITNYLGFDDMIWKRDDSEADVANNGRLDENNHVDCYKFRLEPGEAYNMSLTTIGAGSTYCRISVFNESQQITNIGEALWTYDMASHNGDYFMIWAQDDIIDYYVVIENTQYGANYTYIFEHNICPMTANLKSPNEAEYINSGYITFEWELIDSIFSTSDLDRCIFRIWSKLGFLHYSSEYDSDADLYGDNESISVYIMDYILGKPSVNNTAGCKLENDGEYYWEVVFVSNTFQSSKGFLRLFNLDTTPPSAPVVYEPDQKYYSKTGDYTVNWTDADDGPFDIDYYEVYRGKYADFKCDDSSLLTIAPWRKTEYSEYDMDTETYYYKVIAVDHVGLKSEESDAARYIVSIGGYVPPFDEDFVVLAGDYVEYQFVDVIDGDLKDPNDLYAEFKGRTFQMNSIIHLWLSQVSADSIIPVRAHLYMKWMNTTAEQLDQNFFLLEKNVDAFPFITTASTKYQEKIFELFCNRTFSNATFFIHEKKNTLYFDEFSAIEVVVHTFYKKLDYEQDVTVNDMAIFVVDAHTGVLIELTYYDDREEKGFSLKLINTNIGLSRIHWWLIPLIIIMVIGVVAAIINAIVKKLEKRV